MGDESPVKDDAEASFPDPSQFENFDDVDSDSVELPDNSYDESSVVDEEVND